MQKYVFKKYDPEYKALFKIEREKLNKIIGKKVEIAHIGSTAVPNLGGKGIIDVAIGVAKSEMLAIKRKLDQHYLFSAKFSTPDRLYFRQYYPYKDEKRRVHIHVIEFGSLEWKQFIAFRDYLVKEPKIVEAYAKIKKEAVQQAKNEGEIYRAYKKQFIIETIAKAFRAPEDMEE